MSRLEVALLLICLHAGYVYGIDCTFGFLDKNIFEHMLTTCPRLTDASDKSYCCIDVQTQSSYCCTIEEFAEKTGVGFILPIAIAGVVVIVLVACCISCLCCSCCPWYRRRQGTIYGKVQTPVVQVIQSSVNIPPNYTSQPTQNIPPSYTSQPIQNIPTSYTSQPTQNYVPPYPTDSTAMAQPPPYTNQAYAKQAPYNPAYLPQ